MSNAPCHYGMVRILGSLAGMRLSTCGAGNDIEVADVAFR